MCFKKLFRSKTKEITGLIYFNPTVFVNGIKDIFKDSLKIVFQIGQIAVHYR